METLKLSVSRAKTFEQCARKYYYGYILLLPKVPKDYNAIGSLVHLTLEETFRNWIQTKYKEDLKVCLKQAWKACKETEEYKEAERFKVVDKARGHIIDYYHYYLNNESTKPIEVEAHFTLPITVDDRFIILIEGYIDRIDRIDHKTVSIIDYKTTNKVKYLDFVQLGIYVTACMHGPYMGYNFEAKYILLKHGNIPKNMPNPNKGYLDAVNKIVKIGTSMYEANQRHLKKEEDWKPNRSLLCGYCDYYSQCQKDTGGEDSW